jgi:hypothetical protein
MSDIQEIIFKSESLWITPIKEHLNELYKHIHLPSHDIDHHFRVWTLCKALMHELDDNGITIYPSTVEQALIACLFHDTGLTIDSSEKHGIQSRMICEKFFSQNSQLKPNKFDEILSAIELHDDKSLKSDPTFRKSQEVDLINLVSSSDDLDAFGLIGVYRYLEIYALRGFKLNEIPDKVLSNLANRFANFENIYSKYENFVAKQKSRYNTTLKFFSLLNDQFNSPTLEGEFILLITNVLLENLLIKKNNINVIISMVLEGDFPFEVKNFFGRLKFEFDSF